MKKQPKETDKIFANHKSCKEWKLNSYTFFFFSVLMTPVELVKLDKNLHCSHADGPLLIMMLWFTILGVTVMWRQYIVITPGYVEEDLCIKGLQRHTQIYSNLTLLWHPGYRIS